MSPHLFRRSTTQPPQLAAEYRPPHPTSFSPHPESDVLHAGGSSSHPPAISPDKRRREVAVISTSPYRSSIPPVSVRAPPTLGPHTLATIAGSPEYEWKPVSSAGPSVTGGKGKRGSPPASPRPSTLGDTSPHSSPRSMGSPRLHAHEQGGSPGSRYTNGKADGTPENANRRRRTQSEREPKGGKTSPLARKHVDDSIIAPGRDRSNTTSQVYPGLVLHPFGEGNSTTSTLNFGVDAMDFGVSMDDILDPNAVPGGSGRNGSTSGQAGANIAPWLNDDNSPGRMNTEPTVISGSSTPVNRSSPRKGSSQILNHHTSNPAFGTGRYGAILPEPQNGSSSRSGSRPSMFPSESSGSSSRGASRSGRASDESIQTLGGVQKRKQGSYMDEVGDLPAPMSRQPSMAGARMARFGSTASNMSGSGSVASEKKKGFLGGFLKRKTGQSVSISEFIFDLLLRG
jgi:hypothetical protein